jgi:hypothetical protein
MTGGATTPFPQLRMTQTGANLVLSWPQWGAGYRVQAVDRLSAPYNWTDVPVTTVTNNNEVRANLPLANNQRYYRLWRP